LSSSEDSFVSRLRNASNETFHKLVEEFNKETWDSIKHTAPNLRGPGEFDSDGRDIFDMNFTCDVGQPGAEGMASSKWRFIVGGPSDLHLVAMHEDHKTFLSFYGLTPDGLIRMVPNQNSYAFYLFSDSSCIRPDKHCPDPNCTFDPGFEKDYVHYIGTMFVNDLLQGRGFYMPEEGIHLGPYWYWRNVGPYILITHDETTMEVWLTAEGFVHIAENNTELSCILRNGHFHPRDLGESFDQPGCEMNCWRETGLQLLPERDDLLQLIVKDELGYEKKAKQYRKGVMKKIIRKGSLIDTSTSADIRLLEKYLGEGESSKAVEVMDEWVRRHTPAKPPLTVVWGDPDSNEVDISEPSMRLSENSHELGEGAVDGFFFNETDKQLTVDLRVFDQSNVNVECA